MISLGRFSRPEALAAVRVDLLKRFFAPYRDYFGSHGLDLASLADGATDALEVLSELLMRPSGDLPRTLVAALFCVHEVAETDQERLLEIIAAREGVKLAPDATVLEMALAIWLFNPEALKRIHGRQFTSQVRAFEYYRAGEGNSQLIELNAERITQLEQSLAVYFEKKKRGYGCHIHHYPHEHEDWFLICHGGLFRREMTWESGQAASIAYRPERLDLVVYDALTKELRINTRTDSLREHYRKQFGFYLFGRESHFEGTIKYSLEPLIRDQATALITDDIAGLEYVRLTEISYEIRYKTREIRTHQSVDVYRALAQHQMRIPSDARILEASFRIKFSHQSHVRSLTIKPSVALYTRDDDGQLIEQWLLRRGFITHEKIKRIEQLEHILEIY